MLVAQELLKERQGTATLKAKMAEQQRMLCKDLQVMYISHVTRHMSHVTRHTSPTGPVRAQPRNQSA